jgi:hypothetical protein
MGWNKAWSATVFREPVNGVLLAKSQSAHINNTCVILACVCAAQWRLKGSRQPAVAALKSLLDGVGVPPKVRAESLHLVCVSV